jgi:hypothetical protein
VINAIGAMLATLVLSGSGSGGMLAARSGGDIRAQSRPPGVATTSGDLRALVGSFTEKIPRRSSGDYEAPSSLEARRMAQAYHAIRADRLDRAARLARRVGYAVRLYTDTVTRRRLVELAPARDRARPGWGLFLHDRGSRSRLVIEVAHPVADVDTEKVGVELFRRARATDLFVAGAHRRADRDGSADVAHRADSVFQAVHRATVGRGAVVIQPHGFDASRSERGFGDSVLSDGTPNPPPLLLRATDALRGAGYDVCLFTGQDCSRLAAETNVQGQATREAGGVFMHVELARQIRVERADRVRVTTALGRLLR